MASRPYSPLAIANYFVEEFGADPKSDLEHMKLQKLVYCAYGWWIAFQDTRLTKEPPQVWRYGPVFKSLYHTLKPHGRSSIRQPQSTNPFTPPDQVDPNDCMAEALLSWVWDRYGRMSGFALSQLTHEPGTPWYQVAQERSFIVPRDLEIPDPYIVNEFRGIHAKETGSQAAD